MQIALKSNEWRRICDNKTFKIELQKGVQTIQTFGQIGSPHKLGPPSSICRNLKTLREVLPNQAECIEI